MGGSGTINGNVVNGGLLALGDPQTLTIQGDYEQTNDGTLAIALAGLNPASIDHLNVSGYVALDSGTILELVFIDGYAPKAGDRFDFLTFGSLDPANDAFGSVKVEGLQPGFEYTLGDGRDQRLRTDRSHLSAARCSGCWTGNVINGWDC